MELVAGLGQHEALQGGEEDNAHSHCGKTGLLLVFRFDLTMSRKYRHNYNTKNFSQSAPNTLRFETN